MSREQRQERKRQKLRDELDDQRAYLSRWGFGMLPSEIRKREVGIEKLEALLAGDDDAHS